MKKPKKEIGFTLIETLMVLAIVAVLAGFMAFFVQNFQVQSELDTATNEIIFSLRAAETKSVSGAYGATHGMHLEAGKYVLFRGDTYDASNALNREILLANTIVIANIALTGGGTDILFTRPEGKPSAAGEFEIEIKETKQKNKIKIYDTGLIEKQ